MQLLCTFRSQALGFDFGHNYFLLKYDIVLNSDPSFGIAGSHEQHKSIALHNSKRAFSFVYLESGSRLAYSTSTTEYLLAQNVWSKVN